MLVIFVGKPGHRTFTWAGRLPFFLSCLILKTDTHQTLSNRVGNWLAYCLNCLFEISSSFDLVELQILWHDGNRCRPADHISGQMAFISFETPLPSHDPRACKQLLSRCTKVLHTSHIFRRWLFCTWQDIGKLWVWKNISEVAQFPSSAKLSKHWQVEENCTLSQCDSTMHVSTVFHNLEKHPLEPLLFFTFVNFIQKMYFTFKSLCRVKL